MSLSQYIRDNTDDGKIVASVLIDVLEGRLAGTKIDHRLTAARLLTIYGHEDADDFIAHNTLDVFDRDWSQRIQVEVDPAISSYIWQRSDGGREICQFLIDVVKGEIEGIHVGHRVWAARELLNRAYGKSPGRPLPKPPGSTGQRRSTRKTHQGVPSAPTQAVTPAPAASTAVLDGREQQSDQEIDPRIDIARDVDYWLDIYDSPRYEFMEKC